jgi:HrpA-like RNA helicase
MSATLGGGLAQDLQQVMGEANQAAQDTPSSSSGSSSGQVPVVVSEGRSYPVTTHYLGRPRESMYYAQTAVRVCVYRIEGVLARCV